MGARLVRAAGVACAILVTALTEAAARAADIGDIALEQLEPAPAGDAFFGVPSPFIGGHLAPRGLVLVSHAEQPLVLSTDSASGAVVSRQTILDINASLALWDRVLVGALLPIVIAQAGESPTTRGVAIPSPSSAAVGDLRLSARIRLFGEDPDPFQIGVGLYFHVPTGESGVYAGEGALRDSPHLLLGGRFGRYVWSASGGMVIRGSDTPSSIAYGAGFAVRLLEDRLQIGPEVFASTPIQEGRVTLEGLSQSAIEPDQATNLEVLLGVRARLPLGFVVGAGAGAGLTDAIGTPALRIVGALGWERMPAKAEVKVADMDEDGLLDAADACPYAHGPTNPDPKRSGCPVVDADDDGVPDPDDACPSVSGDVRPGTKTNGCPEPPPSPGG
jgi:OmpA-OmpF porin, OOP family